MEKSTNVVWHEQSITKEIVENKMGITALSFGLPAYLVQENQHLRMQLQERLYNDRCTKLRTRWR